MSDAQNLLVAGAGAFGTALAQLQAAAGRDVCLLARDQKNAETIQTTRENHTYLPGIVLEDRISVTADMTRLTKADIVLAAIPTQHLRAALAVWKPHLGQKTRIVLCAKGIETSTGAFVSQIVKDVIPGQNPSILSGPGFASDIAQNMPTAMTLAHADEQMAATLSAELSTARFRLYDATDVRGVEIGGALKNVIAIAAGVVDGMVLGRSAAAALIARGLAEMSRLGQVLGGRAETLSGLSGLGDLVLTATSDQSRNYRFGQALGQGVPVSQLLGPEQALCEGAYTAQIAHRLARKHEISLPIAETVANLIEGNLSVGEAIHTLLSRPLRSES